MNINTYNACYEIDKGWWIPIRNMGTVFFVDKYGKSTYIGLLSEGKKDFSSDIAKVFALKDIVFFFSRVAYEVWVYDKKTEKITYYKYYNRDVDMISNVEFINGKAWIFPNNFSLPIIAISLDQNMCVDVVEWNIEKKLGENSITRTVIIDYFIYFMNRVQGNIYIIELNTLSNQMRRKKIQNAEYANCLTVDNENIYLLYRNIDGLSNIEIIDRNFSTERYIDVSNFICLSNSVAIDYFKMIITGELILMFSSKQGEIVSINLKTGEHIIYVNEDINSFSSEPGAPLINDIQVLNENIYIFSPVLGDVYEFNIFERKIHKAQIDIEDNVFGQGVYDLLKQKKIIKENRQIELANYLSAMLV